MGRINISGKRIKLARVKQEMAQIDLAVALSDDFNIPMTQNGVSAIERGERVIKDFEVIALAKILEVHPMWILFGDEVPEEYGLTTLNKTP